MLLFVFVVTSTFILCYLYFSFKLGGIHKWRHAKKGEGISWQQGIRQRCDKGGGGYAFSKFAGRHLRMTPYLYFSF